MKIGEARVSFRKFSFRVGVGNRICIHKYLQAEAAAKSAKDRLAESFQARDLRATYSSLDVLRHAWVYVCMCEDLVICFLSFFLSLSLPFSCVCVSRRS